MQIMDLYTIRITEVPFGLVLLGFLGGGHGLVFFYYYLGWIFCLLFLVVWFGLVGWFVGFFSVLQQWPIREENESNSFTLQVFNSLNDLESCSIIDLCNLFVKVTHWLSNQYEYWQSFFCLLKPFTAISSW